MLIEISGGRFGTLIGGGNAEFKGRFGTDSALRAGFYDTGRQVRKDKRGAIPAQEPPALKKLSLSPDHWTRQVKGVGSGFWRVVGAADAVEEKARAM